jgi:hypothetical protein
VPQGPLHRHHIAASGNQCRRDEVAQVVQLDPGDSGGAQRSQPPTTDYVLVGRIASGADEQPSVRPDANVADVLG